MFFLRTFPYYFYKISYKFGAKNTSLEILMTDSIVLWYSNFCLLRGFSKHVLVETHEIWTLARKSWKQLECHRQSEKWWKRSNMSCNTIRARWDALKRVQRKKNWHFTTTYPGPGNLLQTLAHAKHTRSWQNNNWNGLKPNCRNPRQSLLLVLFLFILRCFIQLIKMMGIIIRVGGGSPHTEIPQGQWIWTSYSHHGSPHNSYTPTPPSLAYSPRFPCTT